MHYPEFFDAAPTLTLRDPLADFLGAAEGGLITYRYVDVVKAAGHSCPTVASAWLMTVRALAALYPDSLPERGGLRIEFRNEATAGVTGVIANVVCFVTGATHDTGFKGIAGHFDRRGLLAFGGEIEGEIRFTRTDTGAAVVASVDLDRVPRQPDVAALMPLCIAGTADATERAAFAAAWQARVRCLLLEHANDPQTIRIEPAARVA